MVKRFFFSFKALALVIAIFGLSQSAYAARVNASAHIIESSIANLKNTEWTLYRSTTIAGDGEGSSNLISTKLNSFKGPIQSMLLPLGQYILKAQYGHAVIVKIIKIDKDNVRGFINLKIVFNLGALKMSSSLGNSDESILKGVNYVVRNIESGKIVLETDDVSKTYYLNQGDYNITAHLGEIVLTEANVKIIANNMNDVIIRHKVGQINLNIDNVKSNISDLPPTWRFVGAKNNIEREVATTENRMVLLPVGDYKLFLEWGEFSYVNEFGMHPGQIIEFKIPKQ